MQKKKNRKIKEILKLIPDVKINGNDINNNSVTVNRNENTNNYESRNG